MIASMLVRYSKIEGSVRRTEFEEVRCAMNLMKIPKQVGPPRLL